MFRRHNQGRRHTNIFIVIFRLTLSIVMFTILIGGIYSAYKYFSGYDPLKFDPLSVAKNLFSARSPQDFIAALSLKAGGKISGTTKEEPQKQSRDYLFRFLLFADSHADSAMPAKALSQAKESYPDLKFIIGLGDWSEVGTLSELREAKQVLDSSGLRYFLTSGDHDLWDCRNRGLAPASCFNQVFGPTWQAFDFENFRFLILDNSDNYSGLGDEQSRWIDSELEKLKQNPAKGIFVFLHEPLYHPSSEHFMGKSDAGLKEQARDLMFRLKAAGVKKVFAADTHFFSQYEEPVTGLAMMTVGALTLERNPQAPRFAVVSIFEDGNTKVEDVTILGL